jgi:hypothetical protein
MTRYFIYECIACVRNRDSLVGTLDMLWAELPGFDSHQGRGIFTVTTSSRSALWPIQPPVQWEPATLSSRVKRPAREVDHSPPSTAADKNVLSYISTTPYVFMAWYLVKHRNNFTITFLYIVCVNRNRTSVK